ncbi:hypothetical protein TIFTF001_014712 [Ficus carica]|uniref:Uncharacterized protein n=1 Tax=Ficus carica TaxID=3494 RepID=A0AA88A382_FICCA|nr:hypothetical protein TIFTF001_014712 [Ficus carica]
MHSTHCLLSVKASERSLQFSVPPIPHPTLSFLIINFNLVASKLPHPTPLNSSLFTAPSKRPESEWLVANSALVEGIPLCGWHSRNHGTLHTEQASHRGKTPAQRPQFSLGGRTKDLWKSGYTVPWTTQQCQERGV